jgi:membrane associated rhomboid family serine protease
MVCDMLEPHFWMWVQTLPYDFARAMAQRWGESQVAGMRFGVCVGASASVCGLIGAFAAICPRVRLLILLFYVIPVRLSARALALLLAFVSLAAGMAATGRVAHAAHLVGLVAGYLWARRGGRVSLPVFGDCDA